MGFTQSRRQGPDVSGSGSIEREVPVRRRTGVTTGDRPRVLRSQAVRLNVV